MSDIAYNPLDPTTCRNPYPIYARLREEAPLYRIAPLGVSVLSRYEDVRIVLKDPLAFSSRAMQDLFTQGSKSVNPESSGPEGETLIGTDPPLHTRLRKIVNRAFTPRRIAALEPRIRQVTAELAAGFAGRGECELISELAAPLPVTIIAEILGVDSSRRAEFKRWSDDFLMMSSGQPTPEQKLSILRTDEELGGWVDETVAARRARPGDDLISALVAAEASEPVMTSEEVRVLILVLLVAGNETTTNLIANAMMALAAHPEQRALLRARPEWIARAVEEVLRWDTPVQLALRRATRDVELPAGKVREGELLGLLLGAANRDGRQFEDAERFDVQRDTRGHLAFGFGTHFCVGAPLARLEARVALEALVPRLRRLECIDASLEYAPSLLVRGPSRVRFRFEPQVAG